MANSNYQDWSREEVEATVSEYLDMFSKELQGLPYNKTEHRNWLSKLLNLRSHGAIERKYQNISAVLRELGFPYIPGYKPLSNYQQLLFEVVSERLKNHPQIEKIVDEQVSLPATLPHIDDILKTLVKAPELTPIERNIIEPAQVADIKRGFNIDYIAREASNRSLGLAGEEFVKLYEQARLIHSGKELLASKIVHTSKIQGDSAGYDILSFDTNGRERLIEVKTTAYGPLVPFFVTKNELDTSTRNHPVYHLYRVFDFRRQPKLFSKQGSLENNFKLTPTQYLARAS